MRLLACKTDGTNHQSDYLNTGRRVWISLRTISTISYAKLRFGLIVDKLGFRQKMEGWPTIGGQLLEHTSVAM